MAQAAHGALTQSGSPRGAAPSAPSIGEIARNQRIADNDAPYVTPQDMLAELREDNAMLAKRMREAQGVMEEGRTSRRRVCCIRAMRTPTLSRR
jgi:DNA-binding ferritin-like protein